LLDGATGTELERRGAPMHDRAWCAMATLTSTHILRGIHEDYIRAGARVITANTFSSNRLMLEPAGLVDRFEELNRVAVVTARQARESVAPGERVVVAGSMSHQLPILAGADERCAPAVPKAAHARTCFREMAAMLADAGADMLLMEMMSDPDLANSAIEAARATGLPVWVGFSVRAARDGSLVSYVRLPDMLDAIDLDRVDVAGVMHSKIHVTDAALGALRSRWDGPLMAYPDSGYFAMPHWQFVDVVPEAEFAAVGRRWVGDGVGVVGGCCGIGVAHIGALAAAVDFA
jgi:homocysteine S-methyltransferase